ncbi:MAG TPA: transaldolase family protein [Ktedonobacteraceae bacterium]|nr:transaldolase family protein [Chthonomonadales bacterium]HEV2582513.1 transaldolase family protein [Ktedonobacteraceae bacterium]
MAFYIDSAFLHDIMNAAQTVPVAGVTTNPSILLAAQERGQLLSPDELLDELLRKVAGYIFMQPGATEDEQMYAQALSYIEADPRRVIPKIPMTNAGMRVALRLKAQQQRVAFTAVTTVAQAYSAALISADYVIPYYNRMERSGLDAAQRISEIADTLHNVQATSARPTRILTASIKTADEAASALLAGSDDLTVNPEVLLNLLTDPLSEEAIARFTQDWQKLKKL